MADYWKSNPRKFCDFCKCWIADNKPSVEFHENGKRHKDKVAARIKEIGKKSAINRAANVKLENDMQRMEQAAMRSYLRDVELNPDITSLALLKSKAKLSSSSKDFLVKKEEQGKVWHEACTEKGQIYYWNVQTGDSAWDKPVGGFVPMNMTAEKDDEKEIIKKKKIKVEKIKKKEKVKKEINYGPQTKPTPLGEWEVVKHVEPVMIDLQLPEQNPGSSSSISWNREPDLEFKEKIVEFTSDEKDNVPVVEKFKKRKFAKNNMRQSRQRTED